MKRDLTLVDRSNSSIRLTLWGKQAETYEDDGSHPVIAFKGVRINEFRGGPQLCSDSRANTYLCPLCRTHFIYDWR
jgi:replication factor A1